MKYANFSGIVTWSGGKLVMSAGTTTADDDHPLVIERPDLWTDEAPAAHLAGPGRSADRGVERGTRAPGEKRGHKRG